MLYKNDEDDGEEDILKVVNGTLRADIDKYFD